MKIPELPRKIRVSEGEGRTLILLEDVYFREHGRFRLRRPEAEVLGKVKLKVEGRLDCISLVRREPHIMCLPSLETY